MSSLAATAGLAPELRGLGFDRYLGGLAVLAVALTALGYGAISVRRALGDWVGAPARLVEVTVGLSLATAAGLLAGGLTLFSGWWVLGSVVVLGVGSGLVARRSAAANGHRLGPALEPAGPTPPPSRSVAGGLPVFGAVVALTIVGAQWISHTASALGRGMTEGDTLWYHGVFAARFVQEGRLDFFPHVGAPAQGYFPAGSQMLHSMAFFPFDRDLLSPMLNLGFAAVTALAAYCIGRRRGLGWVCVAASAVVMGLPAIVGTHPGQATNDLLCATFVLVAVALVVEGGLTRASLALAGMAAGLAIGTKLTVALPIAVVTAVLVVVAARRRRPGLVVAWLVPLIGLGAFWFLRNWVRADNPLPWYDIDLRVLRFPVRSKLDDNASILESLGNADVWSEVWYPGVRLAFGRAWWLVISAPFLAAVAIFGRDRTAGERAAGLVAGAAGVGYLTMPFTMELGGAAFAATARYAAPALLCGLVTLPVALKLERARFGPAVATGGLGLVVVLNALAPNVDRFAPWQSHDVAIGWIGAMAILVVAWCWYGSVVHRSGSHGSRRAPVRIVSVSIALVAGVALVPAGFALQRHYLEHRYADGAGLRLDPVYEWVSGTGPARVAPFGTIQFYPFFGPSFANRVVELAAPTTPDSGDPAVRCREWERALRREGSTLVLDGRDLVTTERPDPAWIEPNETLEPVARAGASVLFRGRVPIRLTCPPGSAP